MILLGHALCDADIFARQWPSHKNYSISVAFLSIYQIPYEIFANNKRMGHKAIRLLHKETS